MLSQHHRSPEVGRKQDTGASRHRLLVLPPHPQELLGRISPLLQHRFGVLCAPTPIPLPQHPTARDYGVSHSTRYHRLGPKTKRAERRRMTSGTASTTSQPLPKTVHFPIQDHDSVHTSFTFASLPPLAMKLSFPPRPSHPRTGKRSRAVTDVDGELSSPHKKKRRLRLFLITSRLSPEYSSPATNIVDRGSSKIAVWAKQKALGRNLLRKAAILNNTRRRSVRAKEHSDGSRRVLFEQDREQKQLEMAKLELMYGSHDTHTRPVVGRRTSVPPTTAVLVGDHFEFAEDEAHYRPSPNMTPPPSTTDEEEAGTPVFRSPNDAYSYSPPRAQVPRRTHIPLPPSPLGLSNYDAFDLEDDIPDPYSHLDDEEEDQSAAQDEDMRDADPRTLSANTSDPFSSTLSTVAAGTGNDEAQKTPPQLIYSDFSVLDPEEPVFGDYDQVDEGADAIWPTIMAPAPSRRKSPPLLPPLQPTDTPPSQPLPASSSPNFSSLFATSKDDRPVEERYLTGIGEDKSAPQGNELDQERERQKSFMFAQFGA